MKQLTCKEEICMQQGEPSQTIFLAKAELLSEEDARQVAETFKILGDATRIKILHALSRRELCVCDLAAVVAMGQSAVSHQLRLLRGLRLVKYRKEGKMVWYALDDQHVFSLLSQALEHVTHR